MLKVFENIHEWQNFRKNIKSNISIGFVPTMGNLHKGHVSLIQRSAKENENTVVSIFVNPTQFNNKEDLKNYPHTLEQDIKTANSAGANYLFLPNEKQIYPDGARFILTESSYSQRLEGKYRPGHFEGVMTIVMKLLMLIKPHRAYFGEKDYQQLQLVKQMVQAFFLDIDIIGCATIRNEFGLPLSSRNHRLSTAQLEKSQKFPKLLHANASCENIVNDLKQAGFIVEYVEEFEGRRFAAIKLDSIRLIDNIPLSEVKS